MSSSNEQYQLLNAKQTNKSKLIKNISTPRNIPGNKRRSYTSLNFNRPTTEERSMEEEMGANENSKAGKYKHPYTPETQQFDYEIREEIQRKNILTSHASNDIADDEEVEDKQNKNKQISTSSDSMEKIQVTFGATKNRSTITIQDIKENPTQQNDIKEPFEEEISDLMRLLKRQRTTIEEPATDELESRTNKQPMDKQILSYFDSNFNETKLTEPIHGFSDFDSEVKRRTDQDDATDLEILLLIALGISFEADLPSSFYTRLLLDKKFEEKYGKSELWRKVLKMFCKMYE